MNSLPFDDEGKETKFLVVKINYQLLSFTDPFPHANSRHFQIIFYYIKDWYYSNPLVWTVILKRIGISLELF